MLGETNVLVDFNLTEVTQLDNKINKVSMYTIVDKIQSDRIFGEAGLKETKVPTPQNVDLNNLSDDKIVLVENIYREKSELPLLVECKVISEFKFLGV
jgi:hypothetical protein